jgi:hypothetical protein
MGPTDIAPAEIRVWQRWSIPIAIASLGLVINITVAAKMAPTADEKGHLDYGISILSGSPDRSHPGFDSKMPVSALNALPRGISKFLEAQGISPRVVATLRSIRVARVPTILAAFCLSLLVYLYAESLFGRWAGLAAQLLSVMSPSLIAHSTLVTTDLYIALTAVLFLYCFGRFLLRPNTANTVLAALTLALAQLTKFVAVYLYVILFAYLVMLVFCCKYRRQQPKPVSYRHLVALLAFHAILFLSIVNAGFLLDRSFTPFAKYEFRSATFRRLQQLPVLREIPLPVPYPYMQGLDWVSYHNATGRSFGNIVLFGEVRGDGLKRSDGFWTYYLAAYALKEPLGMQILLLLGLWWIVRRRKLYDMMIGEGVLVTAATVLLLMLSLFSNTQIGIRHILPVLVIFIVLSGGAFARLSQAPWQRLAVLCGCFLWVAISVGSYFPHLIPYFNEILIDRKFAYRFLADSNLDWGQNAWMVEKFLRENPDVLLNPPEPVTGRVLVRANLLAGVRPPGADYWLRRATANPVAHVGYAHLLFHIPAAVIHGVEENRHR